MSNRSQGLVLFSILLLLFGVPAVLLHLHEENDLAEFNRVISDLQSMQSQFRFMENHRATEEEIKIAMESAEFRHLLQYDITYNSGGTSVMSIQVDESKSVSIHQDGSIGTVRFHH